MVAPGQWHKEHIYNRKEEKNRIHASGSLILLALEIIGTNRHKITPLLTKQMALLRAMYLVIRSLSTFFPKCHFKLILKGEIDVSATQL